MVALAGNQTIFTEWQNKKVGYGGFYIIKRRKNIERAQSKTYIDNGGD